MAARVESEATGKALRKDAFQLAQDRYAEMLPQLEVIHKQMVENEAEVQKATAKAQKEASDRLMERNRR